MRGFGLLSEILFDGLSKTTNDAEPQESSQASLITYYATKELRERKRRVHFLAYAYCTNTMPR